MEEGKAWAGGGVGGEEGGGWETGRGEEEVKRTAPERGSEASLYKIYIYISPPTSFSSCIIFLTGQPLLRSPPPTPALTTSPLTVELKIKYVDNKIDFTISCLNRGVSADLKFFLSEEWGGNMIKINIFKDGKSQSSDWAFETLFQRVTWLGCVRMHHACMCAKMCMNMCVWLCSHVYLTHADTYTLFSFHLGWPRTVISLCALPSASAHFCELEDLTSSLPSLKNGSSLLGGIQEPLAPVREAYVRDIPSGT